MRYGIIIAVATTALSFSAISASGQTVTRGTAAENAWCATHMSQCSANRDVRDVRVDNRDIHRDARAIQADRALHDVALRRARRLQIERERRIAANDARKDRRDIQKDRDGR